MSKCFKDFGLSEKVLGAISAMGYTEPTPIQELVIKPLLDGRDIIGVAQTGTGKTAAFGIPIVENGGPSEGRNPYALVLAPTRELAIQVAGEMNKIGAPKGIRAMPVYGGQPIERQIKQLRNGVNVVVGTPGRIQDHIGRRTLRLSEVRIVVLDEADEMLDMGFIRDIERILKEVPEKRQTMLFSATMPEEIVRLSARYMHNPQKMRVKTDTQFVEKTKQVYYEIREHEKMSALTRLLDGEDASLTLVFCHTRREVDGVFRGLKQRGYDAGAIHGDHSQASRDDVMRKFRKGAISVLVATDVAARGLDVADVSHVINYSLPQNPERYIHRIGRTGRAGKAGTAVSLVTPRDYFQWRIIEKALRTEMMPGTFPAAAS